jgi:hypothetical protein
MKSFAKEEGNEETRFRICGGYGTGSVGLPGVCTGAGTGTTGKEALAGLYRGTAEDRRASAGTGTGKGGAGKTGAEKSSTEKRSGKSGTS